MHIVIKTRWSPLAVVVKDVISDKDQLDGMLRSQIKMLVSHLVQ